MFFHKLHLKDRLLAKERQMTGREEKKFMSPRNRSRQNTDQKAVKDQRET